MGSLGLITLTRNPSLLFIGLTLSFLVAFVVYNTCMRVLMVNNMFNKDFSSLRTRMFGPGRGRTLSLTDIPGSSSAPASVSGTYFSEDKRSLSSRCVSDPSDAPDMEYGLGLLASGSPTGEHGEVDDRLLDYDSDENATPQQLALENPAVGSAMDIGQHCQKNTTAKPDSNINHVILDPMYHQCRASRISVHRDNLVSISPDSTFRKRIVSQSIPVGSFEDHPGI
jgi:hypothetical protein